MVKFLIGKNGENLKKMRAETKAEIEFKNESHDSERRLCVITGTPNECDHAKKTINESIKTFEQKYFSRANNEKEKSKEINIFLIGEQGASKTLFMSSLLNYLEYGNLDDAMKGKLACTSLLDFQILDQKFELKNLTLENENDKMNGSRTEKCIRTFRYPLGKNMILSFIQYTPKEKISLEDEKTNFKDSCRYLAHFKHINAVCFLLNSDLTKLTESFQYCAKELVTMHKNIEKNIFFSFTDSRCMNKFYLFFVFI